MKLDMYFMYLLNLFNPSYFSQPLISIRCISQWIHKYYTYMISYKIIHTLSSFHVYLQPAEAYHLKVQRAVLVSVGQLQAILQGLKKELPAFYRNFHLFKTKSFSKNGGGTQHFCNTLKAFQSLIFKSLMFFFHGVSSHFMAIESIDCWTGA